MVTQITNKIRISVQTGFEGIYLKENKRYHAFNYKITIENQGTETVQLLSRYWEIFDALNIIQTVEGEGVVGLQPIIKPNESHSYVSGCMIHSAFGAMQGHYNMINMITNESFQVIVPTFHFATPFVEN